MSGTLIPLAGTAVDPFKLPQAYNNALMTAAQVQTEQQRPAAVAAQAQHERAAAGLTEAQTVGVQIANSLQRLLIGSRLGVVNQLSGLAGVPSSYDAEPSGDGASGMDLLRSGGSVSLFPAALAPAGPDGGVPSPAPGPVARTALPPAGGAPNALAGAAMQQGGGINVPGVGTVPPLQFFGYQNAILSGKDPTEAASALQTMRNSRLAYLAGSATDQPGWNRAIDTATQEGWLSPAEAQPLYGHFNYRDAYVRALSGAKEQVSYQQTALGQGLLPGVTGPQVSAAAMATREPIETTVRGTDGNYYKVKVPRPSYVGQTLATGGAGPAIEPAAPGGAPGAGPPPGGFAAPSGAMPFQRYAGLVSGAESGAQGAAAVNPRSGASGEFQWMPGTWAATVRRIAPDLAAGKSDDELFAMLKTRAGQAIEPAALQAFTRGNAEALAADGAPVNASSLYLAHWFGPTGMKRILSQPADTPLADIRTPPGTASMQQIIAQNPVLKGMTVGDLARYVRGRFGLTPVDLDAGYIGSSAQTGADVLSGGAPAPSGQAGAAAPAAAAPTPAPSGGAAPLAPGVAGTPLPPGAQLASPPELGPLEKISAEAAGKEQEETAKAYGEQAGIVVKNATSAPVTLERLAALENAAEDFRTSGSGPARFAAYRRLQDSLQIAGIPVPDWLTARTAGAEVINKLGGFLAANMVKMMGERAARVFDQVKGIQPNIEQTTGGYHAVLESIRQDALRDQDLGRFQTAWVADPAHHRSIAGMMDAFNAAHPIEAYASRVVPYPMPKSAAEAKPNVFYRLPDGRAALWDGSAFHPVTAAQPAR